MVIAGALPRLTDQLRPARVLLGAGLLAAACGALYLRRRYPVSVAAVTLLAC